MSTRCISWG